MRLPDGYSLLSKTFQRASQLDTVTELILVTNREYIFQSLDEFANSNCTSALYGILEPVGRNTAPAIAMAAHLAQETWGPETILVVLPADHVISTQAAFQTCVAKAVEIAQDNWLVTFGVEPTYPEIGYGYVEIDRQKPLRDGFAVKHFKEKPNYDTAVSYLSDGDHFWNSGMFCFKAETFLKELMLCNKDIAVNAVQAWNDSKARHAKFDPASRNIELDQDSFTKLADISIDYAVLEKSHRVAMIPGNFEWNDIGSWRSVSELTAPDQNGNRLIGETITLDTRNTFVQSENRLIATVGVDNLMIVDTPDALLVADRDRTQDVKRITEELRLRNHEAHKSHLLVNRPWGSYTVLEDGVNHKIKRIEVRPSAALSLQMHHHRSEHWIVVEGSAKVVRGEDEFLLSANQSTYIPSGTKHRLENPGHIPLIIIEVQTGDYLGEDDIVRFEDIYGRAKNNF